MSRSDLSAMGGKVESIGEVVSFHLFHFLENPEFRKHALSRKAKLQKYSISTSRTSLFLSTALGVSVFVEVYDDFINADILFYAS